MKIGDKYWLVWNGAAGFRGANREVTIDSVGRKWATMAECPRFRVSINTLAVDGRDHMSPGQLWSSKEAYDAHHRKYYKWVLFRRAVHNMDTPNEELTVEAANILGISLQPKE